MVYNWKSFTPPNSVHPPAKLRVAGDHGAGLRVAAVQLDVVHPPF